MFKDFIALLFFGVLLIVGSWTLFYSLQTQWAEIQSTKPLIVLSSFHGYIPGALVGLLFMCTYAANRLRCGIRQQPLAANNGKVTAIGVLLGLLLVVVGSFVLNAYWQNKAAYAGYLPCPALTLLTNRTSITAWSKNEALCFDNDTRRIIVRGTPAETAQLAQHVEARVKQQQAKQRYLQQEAKKK